MPRHVESKELKFDSWSQTAKDITIILHAGRRLNPNDISVKFTDRNVDVGLTDGRKWSCRFWRPVVSKECKVQLRKMKIHLVVTKKAVGVWGELQAGSTCVDEKPSDSNTEEQEDMCVEMSHTKSDPVVEHVAGAKDFVQTVKSASSAEAAFPVRSKSEIVHGAHGHERLHQIIGDQTNSMGGDCAVVDNSNNPSLHGIINEGGLDFGFSSNTSNVQSHASTSGTLADSLNVQTDINSGSSEESVVNSVSKHKLISEAEAVRASQSFTDLTSGVSSMDLDCQSSQPSQGELVHQVPTIKHDFYERDDGKLVAVVYVKEVVKSSLKLQFEPHRMLICFQTGDSKFRELHSVSSSDVKFYWPVELAGEIRPEKCFYKAMTTKIEITLMKLLPKKWGCLENLVAKDKVFDSTSSGRKKDSNWSHPYEDQTVKPAETRSRKSSVDSTEEFDDEPLNIPPVEKPTCKVSPLMTDEEFEQFDDMPPQEDITRKKVIYKGGWTGLENLGNTCFMNSVLQVLVNTAELKEYFLDGHYLKEINTVNPLGMKGDMAKAFAQLMIAMWTGDKISINPSSIKKLMAKKQSRFSGFLQHDAEEFMEFILDGLHEDLNRIIDKPYSAEEPDYSNRPEKFAAEEQWKRHLARNNSHIVDTFQGQFRSKLTCPVCQTVSVKFDPFSVVSVPVPKEKKRLNVIFLPRNLHSKPTKYQLLVDINATMKNVKDALCKLTQVHPNQLRIMEIRNSRVQIIFNKDAQISQINENSQIVACEVFTAQQFGRPFKELVVQQSAAMPLHAPKCCSACGALQKTDHRLKRCKKCYRSAYCNATCQKKDWPEHKKTCRWYRDAVGCPFIISLPVSQINYRNLYEQLDNFARHSVNAFQPPGKSCQKETPAEATVPVESDLSSDLIEGKSEVNSGIGSTLETMDVVEAVEDQSREKAVRHVIGTPQNPVPLSTTPSFSIEIVSPASRNGTSDTTAAEKQKVIQAGEDDYNWSSVVQLEMVWNNEEESDSRIMIETKPWDSIAETVVSSASEGKRNVTLHDCLELFCEPELLASDQTWFCPRCKLHCRATKELSLWRMPRNLIIQIKRFSFANALFRNSKIEDMVEFPLKALDMSPYFKSAATEEYEIGDRTEQLYDLYAVINHYGTVLGGHYTAFARTPQLNNPEQNERGWRLFDDSQVINIGETSVVSRAAYVLFYRRRDPGCHLSEGISLSAEVPVVRDDEVKPSAKTDPNAAEIIPFGDVNGEHKVPKYRYKWTDIDEID